jgi:hypothetical protein
MDITGEFPVEKLLFTGPGHFLPLSVDENLDNHAACGTGSKALIAKGTVGTGWANVHKIFIGRGLRLFYIKPVPAFRAAQEAAFFWDLVIRQIPAGAALRAGYLHIQGYSSRERLGNAGKV